MINFILGNPPYISLYGRRDKKKNEEQRIYYLKNYKQFPNTLKNGKINYIMLFIEHSIDFLKNNGKLCFIIDIAFFETAYLYCRKYLLENVKIHNLYYNIKGFDYVVSGQLIITIEKEKVESNNVLVIDYEKNKKQYINQSKWYVKNDEYKYRIIDEKNQIILDKIFKKQEPLLKDLYPDKNLRTCTMLLNKEKEFTIYNNDNKKENVFPYYEGSKGLKYKYSSLVYDKYFVYDEQLRNKINEDIKIELTKKGIKNKKRIGLGNIETYKNPKIFIRQSSNELIATYENKIGAANNSLYIFSLYDKSIKSISFLKYLCGLLNSDLYTFFAINRRIIRINNGKQPQIKISDLYQIPIPDNLKLQNDIINLVDNIYQDKNNLTKYKKQIDFLLYKYYNITNE